MTQQCVNCPGAEDHSTAQCPLVSEQNKDAERARVVDAMCMTWRHDFGLDRKEDELGSCGMTDTERDALRRQMGQLYDHHCLPVGVPDGYMPIPTAEQLADALDGVRCFHDMSAELIAPRLLANLLASTIVNALGCSKATLARAIEENGYVAD